MNDEVNKFFDDLPGEDKQLADIFDTDKDTEEKPADKATEGDSDKEAEPRKNRRHRRLEQALERKDAEILSLRARADARAEIERGHSDTKDIDPRLIRLYGDSDEGREAARLHMELLQDARREARDEALQEIEDRSAKARDEERQLEEFIDGELEAIEDEYNVDITSDAPAARKARRELGELVARLSPKDKDGNISAYADFGEAWEMYQLSRTKGTDSANRAKEIAARTMEKSGAGAPAPQAPTPGFRGWMKDFQVN